MHIKTAFWNLQNLFDARLSEIAADLGFTPDRGWTEEVVEAKLDQLAAVIRLMHDGAMPDLLGVCEVENKSLMERLAARLDADRYAVAHIESPDIRGIDTSLLYDRNVFYPHPDLPIRAVKVTNRYPTRDIFEVPLRLHSNDAELIVFVNHWPSRSRGKYESEPLRISVASHLGKLVDQHLKIDRLTYLNMPDSEETMDMLNYRWNRNILLMGDFNDEPFNRSILDYLKASSGTDHLEEKIKAGRGDVRAHTPSPAAYFADQAYLFNCMWPFLALPDTGTLHYSGATNSMNVLDQFMISRGLYYGLQGLRLDRSSVKIFKPDIMSSARKKRPVKFDFDSKGNDAPSGYSDHFPITAELEVLQK
jgi:hypothetical protein